MTAYEEEFGAYDFDGINDRAWPSDESFYQPTKGAQSIARSFSIWVKPDTTSQDTAIFGHFTDGFWTRYGIGIKYTNGVVHAMGETDDSHPTLTASLTDTDRYTHVVAVCGPAGALYVNGVLMARGVLDDGWDYYLSVGHAKGSASLNDRNFDGKLSNWRCWHRALTIDEVQALYKDKYYGAKFAEDRVYLFPTAATGDTNVSASVANLTLTTNAATITYDVNASCSVANLTLSTHNATVTNPATGDVNVAASTAALTLATLGATVTNPTNDVDVAASTAALTLQEYSATVDGTAYIPPVTRGQGGGRVMRKGEFPEWWREEEEPQPKETEELKKSSAEQIAELAETLPIPKRQETKKVVPLRKKTPKKAQPKQETIEPKKEVVPPPIAPEIQALQSDMKEIVNKMSRMEKRLAAALLLLLRNMRR